MLNDKPLNKSGEKNKFILKHKGLIAAFVLPFVFWGMVLTLWFFRAPQNPSSLSAKIGADNTSGVSIGDIILSQNNLDEDKDGLSNWEESVYGTNSNNPDSDGDTYLDGEEVLSGHNPAKKGPNDLLTKNQGALTKEDQNKKTATESFSKIALLNFFNSPASKNISNLSPEQLDAELKKSFKNDPEALKEFQKEMRDILYEFIPKDLNKRIIVIKDSGDLQGKNVQEYADNFVKLIKKTRLTEGKDLHQLLNDIFEKKDYTNIDISISYYNNFFKELLAIPAPESILIIHRNYLLLFYETGKSVEMLKDWDNDPVRAFVAIQKLAGWLDKLEEIEQSINKIGGLNTQ